MLPLSRLGRRFALCATVLATPCAAQWTQLSTATAPSGRTGHAMDYSEIPAFQGFTYLFGGFDGAVRDDTWRFDGIDWLQLSPTHSPPPRRAHALVATGRSNPELVVFGGDGGTGVLGDTWTLTGNTWFQNLSQPSPGARQGHAMVFDSIRNRVVLFGGANGGRLFDDTWEFDGSNWQQVGTANAPGPRSGHAMTFDSVRGEVVMFGGMSGRVLDDTWTFDGNDWRLRSQIPRPTPRSGASLAFDRQRARTVLFGGSVAGTTSNDTWEWDGRSWHQRAPIGSPSARAGAAMTYDRNRGEVILFGGLGAAPLAETWSFRPEVKGSFTSFGDPCPAAGGAFLRKVHGSEPRIGDVLAMEISAGPPLTLPFGVIGFSRERTAAGLPLPRLLPGGCLQRVDAFQIQTLSAGRPTAWRLSIPGGTALIGARFYVQAFLTDAALTTITGVTNAAEVFIGPPVRESTIVESFVNQARMDTTVSSGSWSAGQASPGDLGGDGRHGSFDPTLGRQVAPGTYEFDTDSFTIPGSRTLSGRAETITDGRFFFTDFTVPTGITVRFVGSNPAIVFVRGNAEIRGTIDANAEAMTVFQARDRFSTALLPGQPGGRSGPGGGQGGDGGNRCGGSGPVIVGGVNTNDGQGGEDVALPAGHAYTARSVGTGGAGASLFPISGHNSSVIYRVSFGAFCGMLGAGGGGGGFGQPGGIGTAVTTPSPPPATGELGPPAAGGIAFNPFPIPIGASSLDHFSIGGSGGGGGGSHPFLAVVSAFPDTWRAGAGGSGGGGVLAVRAGRDLTLATSGSLEARGGVGVLFSSINLGIPAPGGGGSGGSVVLQGANSLVVSGAIDTSGGSGSAVGNIVPILLNGVTRGGAGAAGLYRLETGAPIAQINSLNLVPPLNPATAIGPLTDRDAVTGSRSLWLGTGRTEVPIWLRYEAEVVVDGQRMLFSDDPAVGMPANTPLSPVTIRFQGAPAGPSGGANPTAGGPWRTGVAPASVMDDTISRDAPHYVRFDLVFDTTTATSVGLLRLQIFYR